MSPSSSIATALKKDLDTTLYSTFLYRRLYGLDSFIGQVRGVKFMCPKVYNAPGRPLRGVASYATESKVS